MPIEFITDKYLPGKIEPGALSWCPSMDLAVFALADGTEVSLYRLSGQKVWSSSTRKRARPVKSSWKSDGKSLAVLYEDHSYQIFSTMSGKIVYTSEPRTTHCVEWIVGDFSAECESVNRLVNVDVLKHLPKLPSLTSGKQFLSRLPVSDLASVPVELLIQGGLDGSLMVDIYGMFPLGSCSLATGTEGKGHVSSVVADTKLSVHYCLFQSSGASSDPGPGSESGLFLVPVRTPLVAKFGIIYLPEVTLVPAMINDMVDYIKAGIMTVTKESRLFEETSGKAARQFTAGKDDLSAVLFESLIACHYGPSIRDWIDNINESGFKKYSSTLFNCYENSRRVYFEEVLPACERALVLLSRLRGLSRWWDRGSVMGLNTDQLTSCIYQVEDLARRSNKLLWGVSGELELYKSFISWLGHCFDTCLDRAVVKPNEKFYKSEVETRDVAKYLTQHFNHSVMDVNTVNDMLGLASQIDQSCRAAFDNIKDTLRETIKPQKPLKIANSCYRSSIRFVNGQVFVLVQESQSTDILKVIKYAPTQEQEEGNTGVYINLGESFMSADFIDDVDILILQGNQLIMIDYTDLPYQTAVAPSTVPYTELKHHKASVDNFEPTAMTVYGSKDRRLGCLLAKDCQHYLFFDLDEVKESAA